MSGHHKFSQLTKEFSEEQKAVIDEAINEYIEKNEEKTKIKDDSRILFHFNELKL